jgi:HD-GYP domain-containing protein (c-di-GMP phosphodiesterase class II)
LTGISPEFEFGISEFLSGVRFLQDTKSLIRRHHERFDGKGYPDGISGEEIPLGARMISLAGAFDCITHDCTYHPKRCVEDTVSEIEQCAGTQFDPTIVKAFLENRDHVVRRYFPGSESNVQPA